MTVIISQAVSGLQDAQKQLRTASQNIQKNITGSLNEGAAQTPAGTSELREIPDRALVEDIVDIKQAEISFKANAHVIETEREIIGTLLDITE